jgi:hypothetical protein
LHHCAAELGRRRSGPTTQPPCVSERSDNGGQDPIKEKGSLMSSPELL